MRQKTLTPAARRALAEADARRKDCRERNIATLPTTEIEGGEPTRYGDWEVKGLAKDF